MKVVLVTGGRDYFNAPRVHATLDEEQPVIVMHGAAAGADASAKWWAADKRAIEISCPADWEKLGRAAGPIRNAAMIMLLADLQRAGNCVKILAFPGGPGTADCVTRAKRQGFDVREISE